MINEYRKKYYIKACRKRALKDCVILKNGFPISCFCHFFFYHFYFLLLLPLPLSPLSLSTLSPAVGVCESYVALQGCCCSFSNIHLVFGYLVFDKWQWWWYLKKLGVSALARHFVSSSSLSSWLWGMGKVKYLSIWTKMDILVLREFQGRILGKDNFQTRLFHLSETSGVKLLVRPKWWLANPVKRQFANKGFAREKLSKE